MNEKAIELLQSWLDNDEDRNEQTESLKQTMKDLDENRLSYRKLFPEQNDGQPKT